MRAIAAVIILIASTAWMACAANEVERFLPPDYQGDRVHLVTSMSQIPAPVVEALKELCGGCDFADFDAPWNPTDVANDLPTRRIVQAGYSDEIWFVQYDHGGRGRHSHTAVFVVSGSHLQFHGGSMFVDTEPGHATSVCRTEAAAECDW